MMPSNEPVGSLPDSLSTGQFSSSRAVFANNWISDALGGNFLCAQGKLRRNSVQGNEDCKRVSYRVLGLVVDSTRGDVVQLLIPQSASASKNRTSLCPSISHLPQ